MIRMEDNLLQDIHSTVNNFMDWPHSGAAIRYSGYVEPRDGAMSILLSSQQEAVACVQCIVFRKKANVVKGSCLRVVEIENATV
jgi:hypothetical protein